jgi:hypothetical protein
MRTSLTTLMTVVCVACGAAMTMAVEANRQGGQSLRTVFDYSGPSQSAVMPSGAVTPMPVADAGYVVVSDEQADAAKTDSATGCCDSTSCCSTCGGNSCDCNCNSNCWLSRYENCTLESLLGMECCSDWNVGGWMEFGYMSNNVPLSQAYNDLLSFDDVPDHLHAEQIWFYSEKTTDGSCGCDWGGRFDILYGTDAQKTQAFGNPGAGVRNFGTWDASLDHGEYGWAMPQAYAEVAYQNLKVKLGHFFTLVGYEVVPATGNFFRTHSYTMFNSEPFTHTGALASYEVDDCLTIHAGWVLGWDTGFDQLNSGNAFHGGFIRKLGDNSSLSYMLTYGNFGWRDGGDDNSYSHSVVYTNDLNDCWQYVLQSDYIRTSNDGVSEFDTIGAVNYLFYKVSDKAKLGGRMEWWKADGVSFYEATAGVNLWAAKNIVVRPEWRQDWAPAIGLDEDTFSIDAILTF